MAEALITTAGSLHEQVMFQFNLSTDNIHSANMSNDTTLLNTNMGLNSLINTPSSLFLLDDMQLGGPIDNIIGLGTLQLDNDLLTGWESGFNFSAQETQTFSPGC